MESERQGTCRGCGANMCRCQCEEIVETAKDIACLKQVVEEQRVALEANRVRFKDLESEMDSLIDDLQTDSSIGQRFRELVGEINGLKIILQETTSSFENLLLLSQRSNKGAYTNGILSQCGSIDEEEVKAWDIIELSEEALKKAKDYIND